MYFTHINPKVKEKIYLLVSSICGCSHFPSLRLMYSPLAGRRLETEKLIVNSTTKKKMVLSKNIKVWGNGANCSNSLGLVYVGELSTVIL